MNKLILTQQGIFPINGQNSLYDNLSGTIQGEGKYVGTPSLFIRLSGCNLRCMWKTSNGDTSLCDTPYSSFYPEKNMKSVEEIVCDVVNNSNKIKHIVITGGEPFIQTKPLIDLVSKLKLNGYFITIETNGTVFNYDVVKNVDLISISPKLRNSEYANNKRHNNNRLNFGVLSQFVLHSKDYQFKFVVSEQTMQSDIKEINDVLNGINGNILNSNIYLMPEGLMNHLATPAYNMAAKFAIINGYNLGSRLHTYVYGYNQNA